MPAAADVVAAVSIEQPAANPSELSTNQDTEQQHVSAATSGSSDADVGQTVVLLSELPAAPAADPALAAAGPGSPPRRRSRKVPADPVESPSDETETVTAAAGN